MSLLRFVSACVLAGVVLCGCAKPPSPQASLAQAYHPTSAPLTTASVKSIPNQVLDQPMPERIYSGGNLAGRTLPVATTTDIILRPGEVVLTFDDGPRPGKTDDILATLDRFGVKATFLMLGSAAKAHPDLAQLVAQKGHAVGSHTYDHVDLTTLSRQAALDEIARGENAVADALAGSGERPAPFFRFPYLSQSGFLRTNALQGGLVVLDVDIDSKDYYKDSPETVAKRTLDLLERRGSGIILFHDIHQRTVDMLPGFLADLEARGYSVVRLVPKSGGVFDLDLVTANLEQ